jgi:hypothetical protein
LDAKGPPDMFITVTTNDVSDTMFDQLRHMANLLGPTHHPYAPQKARCRW